MASGLCRSARGSWVGRGSCFGVAESWAEITQVLYRTRTEGRDCEPVLPVPFDQQCRSIQLAAPQAASFYDAQDVFFPSCAHLGTGVGIATEIQGA